MEITREQTLYDVQSSTEQVPSESVTAPNGAQQPDGQARSQEAAAAPSQQPTPAQAADAGQAGTGAGRTHKSFWKMLFSREGRLPDDMDKREMRREIIHIVWPSFMELLLTSLASMVDMMMVSQLGAWATSSVGLTTQPKFIMLAVFNALNTGCTALVARFRGSGEREQANQVMRQALMLTFVLSLIISAVMYFASEPLIAFMGATEEATLRGGTEYLQIQALGLVFVAVSMAVTAALRGVGETKISMIYNIVANVVNVFFNYCFIYGNLGFPRMEVAGASLATIIGQFVAFLMALFVLYRGKYFLRLRLRDSFKPHWLTIKRILNIGIPSIVEQLVMRVGMIIYSRTVALLGTIPFATHNICMNLQQLTLMNGQAFGIAATALLGRSMGEGRTDKAHAYTHKCRQYGMIVSLCLAVLFFFGGDLLISLYNTDPEILAAGVVVMQIVAVMQPLQSSQMIVNGALRGAGDTRTTAAIIFVGILVVRPLCAMLFINVLHWGLAGAWLAMLLDQGLRSLLCYLRLQSGAWMRIRV